MAIDLGSANSSRYYLVSDNSDLTLPDGDWGFAALVRPTLNDANFHKYLLSTNAVGDVNSLNIFIQQASNLLTVYYNDTHVAQATGQITAGGDYVIYVTRFGGYIYVGYSLLGSGSVNEAAGQDISGTQSNGGNIYIGGRNDLNVDRFWRGNIEWAAFSNNSFIGGGDIQAISSGASVISVMGRKLTRMWHWQTAAETDKDIITGQAATRNGAGWADAEDRSAIYAYDPFTYREISPETILINSAPGELTVSGVSGQISVGIEVNGMPGGIDLVGQTANIIQAHQVDAAPDGFAIVGLQGGVIQSHQVDATPGQISVTGLRSQVSIATIINAVPAGISVGGLQAVIPDGVLVSAAPSGISITGLQASVIIGSTIDANPADISITGVSGSISQGVIIDASPGSIAISGVSASIDISMLINAAVAEISITGEQARVSVGGDPIIMIPGNRIIAISFDDRKIKIDRDDRLITVNDRGGYGR